MHNICYRTYEEATSSKTIERDVINMVQSSGDRYGTDRIKFITNQVFDNEEKAKEYIEELKNSFYEGYAVKFYDCSKITNKKIVELQEKIRETQAKRNEYVNAHNVKGYKATYIGCSKCGSKINKGYLSGNRCPVCGTDLRAESTLARIKSFDDRIKGYYDKINEEKAKQKKSCKIKWLVKFEYHS